MPMEDDPYWVARMTLSPGDFAAIRDKAERRVRKGYDRATRAIGGAEDGDAFVRLVDRVLLGHAHGGQDRGANTFSALGAAWLEVGGNRTKVSDRLRRIDNSHSSKLRNAASTCSGVANSPRLI